jgi:hypothetical protein
VCVCSLIKAQRRIRKWTDAERRRERRRGGAYLGPHLSVFMLTAPRYDQLIQVSMPMNLESVIKNTGHRPALIFENSAAFAGVCGTACVTAAAQ